MAMPVQTVKKPVEMLKNMNTQTAKHASWNVRVQSPKIIKYRGNPFKLRSSCAFWFRKVRNNL